MADWTAMPLFAHALPLRYHLMVIAPGVVLGLFFGLMGWSLTRTIVHPFVRIPLILACGYLCYHGAYELWRLIRWASNNYGPGGGPFQDIISWTVWGVCTLPAIAVLLALLFQSPREDGRPEA